MKPLPHHYEVTLVGGPSGYAELSTAGVLYGNRRAPVAQRRCVHEPPTGASDSRKSEQTYRVSASLSTALLLEPEINEA